MKIKDAYGDITIHIRRNSPTDKAIVDEIFKQNVYHLRDDMLQGNVVIDAGANIGAFTIEILRRAKHNGTPVTVFAVEPEPHNLKLLRKNLASNRHLMEDSKVNILPFALGAEGGIVRLSDEHGDSRVSDEGHSALMITLDQLFNSADIKKVDIAKFDIEGYEVPTLLSAADTTLDAIHYCMIEYDEHNGLDKFAELINRFASNCSIETLGVPARGCYIYAERHI